MRVDNVFDWRIVSIMDTSSIMAHPSEASRPLAFGNSSVHFNVYFEWFLTRKHDWIFLHKLLDHFLTTLGIKWRLPILAHLFIKPLFCSPFLNCCVLHERDEKGWVRLQGFGHHWLLSIFAYFFLPFWLHDDVCRPKLLLTALGYLLLLLSI